MTFGLTALAGAAHAVTSSPRYWVVAALGAAMLVSTLLEPGRLERRLALLQEERALPAPA